jgi:hypothetical protein
MYIEENGGGLQWSGDPVTSVEVMKYVNVSLQTALNVP